MFNVKNAELIYDESNGFVRFDKVEDSRQPIELSYTLCNSFKSGNYVLKCRKFSNSELLTDSQQLYCYQPRQLRFKM